MFVINHVHVNRKNRPKQLYHTTIPTRRPVLRWILSPKKRVLSLKPRPLCQKTTVSVVATEKYWRERNALTNGSRK